MYGGLWSIYRRWEAVNEECQTEIERQCAIQHWNVNEAKCMQKN